MPKIYSKNCDYCGKSYRGQGVNFCSKRCAVKTRGERDIIVRQKIAKKLKGNKNALGKKYGQEYKDKISEIVKKQWKDSKLREKKISGLKKFWQTKEGIERKKLVSERIKQMWQIGKLNSGLFPKGEKHWNYNPDRIKVYRKGVYFSKGQRKRLLREKCDWCGSSENLQLDHKLAIMNGGINKDENAQTLCRKCNNLKRDLIDFRGRKNKLG